MQKYRLIVLEGIDCSGKTSLGRVLADRLKPAVLLQFPNRISETGQIIDRFLKKDEKVSEIDSHALHLLYSANRYEKAAFIRESLTRCNVICDRYWYSGAVYSVAKGIKMNWCIEVDKELPQADFVFFIDVNEKTVSKRSGFGTEAHDSLCFQKKVYEIYKRKEMADLMISIDGNQTTELMADKVISIIYKGMY